MRIVDYTFNEETGSLNVDFTLYEDDDEIDRELTFNFWDIEYYLPNVVSMDDLVNITEDMVTDLIVQYLKENEFLSEGEI